MAEGGHRVFCLRTVLKSRLDVKMREIRIDNPTPLVMSSIHSASEWTIEPRLNSECFCEYAI
jgi:hypothetical protein